MLLLIECDGFCGGTVNRATVTVCLSVRLSRGFAAGTEASCGDREVDGRIKTLRGRDVDVRHEASSPQVDSGSDLSFRQIKDRFPPFLAPTCSRNAVDSLSYAFLVGLATGCAVEFYE